LAYSSNAFTDTSSDAPDIVSELPSSSAACHGAPDNQFHSLGCQLKQNETNSNECTLSMVPLHIDITAEANDTMCKGDKLNR
jgi:hypothetical protein